MHSTEPHDTFLDLLSDLHEDDVEGLLSNVVVSHSKVVAPGKWLPLACVEGPESLKFLVYCVEEGSVVSVNCLFGDFRVEIVVFKLNKYEFTISC